MLHASWRHLLVLPGHSYKLDLLVFAHPAAFQQVAAVCEPLDLDDVGAEVRHVLPASAAGGHHRRLTRGPCAVWLPPWHGRCAILVAQETHTTLHHRRAGPSATQFSTPRRPGRNGTATPLSTTCTSSSTPGCVLCALPLSPFLAPHAVAEHVVAAAPRACAARCGGAMLRARAGGGLAEALLRARDEDGHGHVPDAQLPALVPRHVSAACRGCCQCGRRVLQRSPISRLHRLHRTLPATAGREPSAGPVRAQGPAGEH